ncbi:MAG: SspB family protein [Candidatus Puniceispirillaceae bacterium]
MTNDDNSQTGLNYELLVEDALRSVVRSSLRIVENIGLPGETHFYINFITGYDGVELDDSLRAKHPEQMTIVIQHQYADLQVSDDHFSITLFFGGKPSPMIIPFQAVTSFNDPSVGFGLQFGMLDENDDEDDDEGGLSVDEASTAAVAKTHDGDNTSEHDGKDAEFGDEKTAEVVSLDTFRKRPTN